LVEPTPDRREFLNKTERLNVERWPLHLEIRPKAQTFALLAELERGIFALFGRIIGARYGFLSTGAQRSEEKALSSPKAGALVYAAVPVGCVAPGALSPSK
jgi:hypothetical protein